jgi:hypothetical protein
MVAFATSRRSFESFDEKLLEKLYFVPRGSAAMLSASEEPEPEQPKSSWTETAAPAPWWEEWRSGRTGE